MVLRTLCAVFIGLLVATPPARSAEDIPNSSCMDCHADKELTKDGPNGKKISLFVDEAKLKASTHSTNTCVSCHADVTSKHPDDNVPLKHVDCSGCHQEMSASYGVSVHGIAAKNGEAGTATCTDCHDTHSILPPTSPESPLHFSKLAQTCGGCHDEAAKDVAESVHGKALAAGHREAPTCTDCHMEHRIVRLSASSPLRISAEVCSNCHASERLSTKYKMPADRVKTFFESYHGLAAQYGSTLAANCGSCHGFHKILPSTDPESSIHVSNLVSTCGKCHPGATENFAKSKIHVDPASAEIGDEIGQQVNWWVRKIYLVLIFATIGFMLAHNFLVFARKVRARYRTADLSVTRMNTSQRIQHLILAVSFIILAITGFALRFPDSWFSVALGSNEFVRSWSHRVAGVVLLAVGAYHVFYLIARRDGRQLFRDFLPGKKDAADMFQNGKYLAGLSSEKARIGRFGYAEKMEYWAVIWGTVIMGVTGLMIWFKLDVTRFMPRWAVDVATTIHYYEAILACLAIIVWHFYHVIFDPDVYPINWACVNGKVTSHWQEEEHPLEGSVDGNKPKHTAEPAPELATADAPGKGH